MEESTKKKDGTPMQQPDSTLQAKGLRGWLSRWARWDAEHMAEKWFLVFLSTIVGVGAGVSAWLMRWLIGIITKGVFHCPLFHNWPWMIIFLPIAGFGLTAWFCRKLVKEKLEYGCERIRNSLHHKDFKMSWKLIWSPIVACATTLGLGGSAGGEGPIAYSGAAIGSNVSKYFMLQPRYLRILVGIGGGAGIAAIFKAPLGGVFFTLEILRMEVSSIAAIGLVVGCLTAWAVAYHLEGCTLDVAFSPDIDYTIGMFPSLLLLGIACGLYSLYYGYTMHKTEHLAGKISRTWVRVLVMGAIVGPMIYLFPDLYGEGYGSIGKALTGHAYTLCNQQLLWSHLDTTKLMILLLGISAVKAIVTAATNSGGVAGEFTPTLFAGSMVGLLFALCSNTWFDTEMELGSYALCGMAGVMAGGVQAPLMAMFIVVEICGDFGMFFPIFLTAAISYLTTIILNRKFKLHFISAFLHMK